MTPGRSRLARPSVDHQHRGLHGVGAEPVQGLLSRLIEVCWERDAFGSPSSRNKVLRFQGGTMMRNLLVGAAVCAAFGLAIGPAGSAAPGRNQACYSSSADPALRLLRYSVLRIERRGGERVFISAPIKPALTVGVAF
jgi:hypothetical protein